jgi:hypothetical protein
MTILSIPSKIDSNITMPPRDLSLPAVCTNPGSSTALWLFACCTGRGEVRRWQGCSRNSPIKQRHPNNCPFLPACVPGLVRLASHSPPALAFSHQQPARKRNTAPTTRTTQPRKIPCRISLAVFPRTFILFQTGLKGNQGPAGGGEGRIHAITHSRVPHAPHSSRSTVS